MTETIYEGYDKSYIMLGSKDKRFAEAWEMFIKFLSQIYIRI